MQINKIVDKLKDSEPLLDSVLMHVGSMYSALGMFENAVLAHQRAVSILENRYGTDLLNPCLVYMRSSRLHLSLTNITSLLGECSTLLVTPLLGLAKSFGSYGKATKAIGVYERTLTILERNRGSESEDLVVPLFSLGKLLLKEGKADEAEIPFTRYSAERTSLVKVFAFVIHRLCDRFGQSSFHLRSCRILNIYKKTYGEKDGRVGMAMCSLANAKCTKGGLYVNGPFCFEVVIKRFC